VMAPTWSAKGVPARPAQHARHGEEDPAASNDTAAGGR
jgi:hypothetical protein